MGKPVRVLGPTIRLLALLILLFLDLYDVSKSHMGFDRDWTAIIRRCLTVSWFVELINDNSNNKVGNEQRSNDHEYDEVPNTSRAIVLNWLHIYAVCVHADVCHSGPSLCCCQDEKGSHRVNYVVEVRVVLNPSSFSVLIEAVLLRYDGAIVIWAAPVLTFKKTNTDNRENDERKEAHATDVFNGFKWF